MRTNLYKPYLIKNETFIYMDGARLSTYDLLASFITKANEIVSPESDMHIENN